MSVRSARSIRLLVAVGVVAVLVVSLAGSSAADPVDLEASTNSSDGDLVDSCTATPPADFADPDGGNDVIGWVDGYWYDEPLSFELETGDGLSKAQLEALAARTAARYEALRCLAFEEVPAIDVLTREEFAEETTAAYADVDDRTRRFDNAVLETMLLVGSGEDSIDVRERDRTANVVGSYDVERDRIVIVSDDPDSLSIAEPILAHELGHALQDQHFDVGRYARDTTDRDAGALGLIEGDVASVERRYANRCDDDRWSEPCLGDQSRSTAEESGLLSGSQSEGDSATDRESTSDARGHAGPPSWGLHFLQYQPYSDGPSFVDHLSERGGWEAVDAAYEEPPQTTLHTIYPENYTATGTAPPSVDDSNWDRVTVETAIGRLLSGRSHIGDHPSALEEFTSGLERAWTDSESPEERLFDDVGCERISVYRDGEGNAGTVWKRSRGADDRSAWRLDSLLDHLGDPVPGYEHTYEFGDDPGTPVIGDEGAGTTLKVGIVGDQQWIVIAPTPKAAAEIYEREVIDHADRRAGGWERIVTDDGPGYDVIGQAGLTAMLVDPAFDEESASIVSREAFVNRMDIFRVDETDPYEYAQPETDGWRGDRLSVYHDGEGATGTVWELAWRDAEEADRFADAYERLIDHRGGDPVDGLEHTYEFGADSEFDGAYRLVPAGDRLWIVTAPTVDGLDALFDAEAIASSGVGDEVSIDDESEFDTLEDRDERGSGAGSAVSDDGSGAGDDERTEEGVGLANEPTTDEPTTTETSGDSVGGFGVLVAVAALAFVGGGHRRRRQ